MATDEDRALFEESNLNSGPITYPNYEMLLLSYSSWHRSPLPFHPLPSIIPPLTRRIDRHETMKR